MGVVINEIMDTIERHAVSYEWYKHLKPMTEFERRVASYIDTSIEVDGYIPSLEDVDNKFKCEYWSHILYYKYKRHGKTIVKVGRL